ncbi:TlpA family protein disulfide reductase [Sphaerotilus mobilis]|uniref:Thiol-disulfide isomerase/thioredoxin n=1 Tax=Sphaerotilus mobilis TaxID=47994 RepID=A0A4Q7LUH5_9BURK|nr:TlpA disulfide reductase family protein [Sphaerotilus mobilis]RZS57872.1 thiol-disulfide isomerase/thioredoxin [Sphaerotilus mobilis]
MDNTQRQRTAPKDRHAKVSQDRRQLLTIACLSAAGAALSPSPAWAQSPPASEKTAAPPPPVGSRLPLPDFTLLDGRRLAASELAGQVVVLYWWASWCPFCAVQSPLIDQLQRAHRGQGLRVVGLSIDKKPEEASAHLARKGYAYTSAWVSPELARTLPKPKGLPVTVVLGRDGRVVMSESGQLFPEDIEGIARFL